MIIKDNGFQNKETVLGKEPKIVFGEQAWVQLETDIINGKFKKVIIVTDTFLNEKGLKLFAGRDIPSNVIFVNGPDLKTGSKYITVDQLSGYYSFGDLDGADCVVGFGGGVNVDQAKMIARSTGAKLFLAPTKPSAAIASESASIETKQGRISLDTPEIGCIYAKNIEIPKFLITAEVGDMLSGLTANFDTVLGKKFLSESVNMSLLAQADLIAFETMKLEDPIVDRLSEIYSLEVRIGMIGRAYESTRPWSGIEHMFSHTVDSVLPNEKHSMHGIQVAFGVLMGFALQTEYMKLKGLNRSDFGLRDFSFEDVKNFYIKMGLPVSLSEIKLNIDDFTVVMSKIRTIREKHRYTILDQYTDEAIILVLEKYDLLK